MTASQQSASVPQHVKMGVPGAEQDEAAAMHDVSCVTGVTRRL